MLTRRAKNPVYALGDRPTVVSKIVPSRRLNKRQRKQVYRIVNSKLETKFYDVSTTLFQQFGSGAGIIVADATAIPAAPAGIFPGRVGDQIDPSYMVLRWTTDAQATNPFHVIRIIVFQWRIDNTAAGPTISTILDPSVGGAVNVWSAYNYDARHTYTILYDKLYNQQGNTGSSYQTRTFVVRLRLQKAAAKVNYNSLVNTGDHHIYIFIIGSNASGATGALVSLTARLFYKDA